MISPVAASTVIAANFGFAIAGRWRPEIRSRARMMAIANPVTILKPERVTGKTDEPIPILRLPTPTC
jgi:hypothetical protein